MQWFNETVKAMIVSSSVKWVEMECPPPFQGGISFSPWQNFMRYNIGFSDLHQVHKARNNLI